MAISKSAMKIIIENKRSSFSSENFDRTSAKTDVATKVADLLSGTDAQKAEDLGNIRSMITEMADYCSLPGSKLRGILNEVIAEEMAKLDLKTVGA